MIDAVIIDDEPYCCESLVMQLAKYCPEVKVVEVCHSGIEAIEAIRKRSPRLVFLDIEMPSMNGFEMLEQLNKTDFALIFTTSYDQYAIKAIRFSALDYLLKPIDREELQKAVDRACSRFQVMLPEQLDLLLQKFNRPNAPLNSIALPTMEGLQMVPIDSIITCSSDSNYTVLSLRSQQKLVASRTLKEIEEILSEYSFLRVHHSYLVNLNHINKYVKGEGGYLVMNDGSTIDVSRSRKEMLLKRLSPGKS